MDLIGAFMTPARAFASFIVGLFACSSSVDVTSSADSGEGTLRAALAAAGADPRIGRIGVRKGLQPVVLESPLTYAGSQALEIDGHGAVLEGRLLTDTTLSPTNGALVASGGGDLSVRDLVVRGAGGSGIVVIVPASRAGRIRVTLDRVVLEDNGHHGVLVNDLAGYFADPFTEDSAGSPAGVMVRVQACRFERNGRRGLDYDGLRVNEGGAGSLDAVVSGSDAVDNGGDGIELDERDEGDASAAFDRTRVLGNGGFSREDLDDGIDVDEYGPGDLRARLVDVEARRNAQKGVDLTENGEGDLDVIRDRVTQQGNPDD